MSTIKSSTFNDIHPTAIVSKKAHLGYDNFIGPYCVIHDNVRMGNGNRFEAHCSIGSLPEHKAFWKLSDLPGTIIGNNNVVREFCTINGGTTQATVLTSDCIMLRGSHVSHDSTIEASVILSCNAMIGGESYVSRDSNLGLGCILHQRSFVGRGCLLGMGTVVPKKRRILPFTIYIGNPAKELGPNKKLLDEFKIEQTEQAMALDAYCKKWHEINHD